MLRHAKRRATIKGLPFNLCESDITIPDTCPALCIPLAKNLGAKTGNDNSPSLDRIIAHRGYVRGNIIVVSNKANRIKSNATPAEMLAVAKFYLQLLKGKKNPNPSHRRGHPLLHRRGPRRNQN